MLPANSLSAMKILLALALAASAYPQTSSGPLTWSRVTASGTAPTGRYDGTIAYDPQAKRLYVFGGTDDRGDTNELWSFDTTSSTWTKLNPTGALPPARHGHTLNFDPVRRRVVTVAGQARSLFGDVWAYDIASNAWTQLSASGGPSARYGHSTIYDARRDRLVLSHGFTSERGRFDDTWVFDLASNRWTDITPSGVKPLRRCLHHAEYSAARDEMYLYGGCSSGAGPCPQADLWVFNLSRNDWREVQSFPRPSGRQYYGFAYDASRARLVLHGGSGGGNLGDSWEFDPATDRWSELQAAGTAPSARHRHQGTYAEGYGSVFFGGIGGLQFNNLNELWRLGAPLEAAAPSTNPTISSNGIRGLFEGSAGPFAPGEIVSLYGSDLGPAEAALASFSADGKLPTELASTRVLVDGLPAPLYFVSRGQVNLQIPLELAGRTRIRVRVEQSGRRSEEQEINLVAAAPKLFTGLLRVQDVLILYATGAGRTNPAALTGQVAQAPYGQLLDPALVSINGAPAEVLYSGLAPGTTGLVQINVRIPSAQSAAATFRIRLEHAGTTAEATLIPQ